MDSKKKRRITIAIAIITLIVAIICIVVMATKGEDEYLTYDKVVAYVKNGQISKISVEQGKSEITVMMKDGTEKNAVIPSLDEFVAFAFEEIENGSEIEFETIKSNNNGAISFGVNLLGTILIYVVIIFVFKKAISGVGGDCDIKPIENSNTLFSDVAGIEEEKMQLIEVVEFLRNPKRYTKMGAKIPKGILLSGDPGTGKTLLAKAIAGEAGVPFFLVNGSSFEEKFVGVGASRVRKLFKEAKKVAPSIIFIDEFDSVAQRRYNGKSYSEQTLNQLLSEMDGFNTQDNVIVIAATNHMQVLDPAVIRPGRFDRHIYIPKPDVIARQKILEIHSKNKCLEADVSLEEFAKKTVGFSGADLANVLNEAAIYAVNQGKTSISKSDMDEAIARVMVGLEKKNVAISEEDKRLTAVHEAGHAIVSNLVRPNVNNFGISIIPRGASGGYNFFDESGKTYAKKAALKEEIKVLYAGRIAEQIILGDISSGAASDLEKASKIAYLMVTTYAMSDNLLVKVNSESEYNKRLEEESLEKAEKICQEQYKKTEILVKKYKETIIKLADLLCEKEYLSQEEVAKFMEENLG